MDHSTVGRQLRLSPPGYVRFELDLDEAGWWSLTVTEAQGRGYVTASSRVRYDELTMRELTDVVDALLYNLDV